jgi:hypothetical protein
VERYLAPETAARMAAAAAAFSGTLDMLAARYHAEHSPQR